MVHVGHFDRMKKLAAHILDFMIDNEYQFPQNAYQCLGFDGVTETNSQSFYSALLNCYAVRQHVVGWVTAGSDKAIALMVMRYLDLKGKAYLMYDPKQEALREIWEDLKLPRTSNSLRFRHKVFLIVRVILHGRPDSIRTDEQCNTFVVCVPANTPLGIRLVNLNDQALVKNIVRYNNLRVKFCPSLLPYEKSHIHTNP